MKKLVFLVLIVAQSALADLPLKVENVVNEPKEFSINVALGQSFQGTPRTEHHRYTFRLGTRLGVIKNLEVYANMGASLTHNAIKNNLKIEHQTNFDFDNINLGLNYKWRDNDGYPAVLTFAELELISRSEKQNFYGRSLSLGVMLYQSIDPVVLSLTAQAEINLPRAINNQRYQPSHIAILAPKISFAANNQISLTGGLFAL